MAQLVNSARGGGGSGDIEICFSKSIRIVLAKAITSTYLIWRYRRGVLIIKIFFTDFIIIYSLFLSWVTCSQFSVSFYNSLIWSIWFFLILSLSLFILNSSPHLGTHCQLSSSSFPLQRVSLSHSFPCTHKFLFIVVAAAVCLSQLWQKGTQYFKAEA